MGSIARKLDAFRAIIFTTEREHAVVHKKIYVMLTYWCYNFMDTIFQLFASYCLLPFFNVEREREIHATLILTQRNIKLYAHSQKSHFLCCSLLVYWYYYTKERLRNHVLPKKTNSTVN